MAVINSSTRCSRSLCVGYGYHHVLVKAVHCPYDGYGSFLCNGHRRSEASR